MSTILGLLIVPALAAIMFIGMPALERRTERARKQ
jgi:hypothetical protein